MESQFKWVSDEREKIFLNYFFLSFLASAQNHLQQFNLSVAETTDIASFGQTEKKTHSETYTKKNTKEKKGKKIQHKTSSSYRIILISAEYTSAY